MNTPTFLRQERESREGGDPERQEQWNTNKKYNIQLTADTKYFFTMSRAIKAALGRMERYVLSPVRPGRRDKIFRGNGVFGMRAAPTVRHRAEITTG
ncbi:hypothetical protein E4U34_001364 [Claviceps purpurea]|nr:hypothetical protein E4U34_001364 [Claviceps purpurea]